MKQQPSQARRISFGGAARTANAWGLVILLLGGCSGAVEALARRGDAGQGEAASAPDTDGGPDTLGRGCPALPGAPPATVPAPTPLQAAFERDELTGFVHFGLETYDGTEQGDSSKDSPAIFNPTDLDAGQWVRAFRAAGFRQVTLTVKHGTGFCLWPSAYTAYSVKNSPWKNGQGDVVQEFTDAAHAEGMRVGFHLTPWDQRFPSSDSQYEAYFRNLMTELLTHYGVVDEIEFDGFSAPKAVDWKGVVQLAKRIQPDILVWMGPEIAVEGADIRWIGNQQGESSRTQSEIGSIAHGDPTNGWYPSDAPVSVRMPRWFWRASDSPISLKSLQTIYFNTVGMNASLRLNVPASGTGRLDPADASLLAEFGAWTSSLYQNNLLRGHPVTADSTWSDAGFAASSAVDGDVCTYWAAAKGKTSGRLEVTPSAPITFSLISLREPIEIGERVTAYHVEIKQNGTWNKAPTDASGKPIQGSVMGQRQLWQLNPTTAEALALVIDAAQGEPALAEFAVF